MPEEVKTIRQRVLEAVASVAGIHVDRVDPEKTLEAHGLDSVERIEMVMELEDAFGLIEISDADAQRLDPLPVQEWIQYMEARRTAAAA